MRKMIVAEAISDIYNESNKVPHCLTLRDLFILGLVLL